MVWTGYEPRHEQRDEQKLAALVASMGERGWQGRPLLAYDDGNGIHYLTGSHRIAAALALGIDQVPAYVLDARGDDPSGIWEQIIEARDDEALLAALTTLGDVDAIALMAAELAA